MARSQYFGLPSRLTKIMDSSGTVIVLTCFIIAVLLGFAGLVLDLGLIHISQQRLRIGSELAALAAIETYVEARTTITETAAMEQARQRAADILALEENIPPSLGFRHAPPGSSEDPGLMDVRIEAGMWITSGAPPAGFACEMAQSLPCFIPLPAGVPPPFPLNAFRVAYRLPQAYITLLMRLIGPTQSDIPGSAVVAAVVPRRQLYLLDLSTSVTNQNHAPFMDSAGLNQSPSAYSLALRPHANACRDQNGLLLDAPRAACVDNPSQCGFTSSIEEYTWALMGNPGEPPALRAMTDPQRFLRSNNPHVSSGTIHFRDDYRCVALPQPVRFRPPSPNEDPAAVFTSDFLVRHISDDDVTTQRYLGPEPLNSILEALHDSFQSFARESIGDDAAGIVGFDREALDIRSVRGPHGILIRPTDSAWSELMLLTEGHQGTLPPQPERIRALWNNRASRLIMPRGIASMTDTYLRGAVEFALNDLRNNDPHFSTAAYSLTIISDGLVNCKLEVPDANDSSRNFVECTSSNAQLAQAISQLNDIATALVGQRMAVNLVLFGPGAHMLSRRSFDNENECMDDSEARLRGLPFVNASGGNFPSSSYTSPYFGPALLYESVRRTGGLYVPVLPPCVMRDGSTGQAVPESQCRTSMQALRGARCQEVAPGALYIGADFPGVSFFDSSGQEYPSIADDRGRFRCDPQCRPEQLQLSEAIASTLSQSPFSVVEQKNIAIH